MHGAVASRRVCACDELAVDGRRTHVWVVGAIDGAQTPQRTTPHTIPSEPRRGALPRSDHTSEPRPLHCHPRSTSCSRTSRSTATSPCACARTCSSARSESGAPTTRRCSASSRSSFRRAAACIFILLWFVRLFVRLFLCDARVSSGWRELQEKHVPPTPDTPARAGGASYIFAVVSAGVKLRCDLSSRATRDVSRAIVPRDARRPARSSRDRPARRATSRARSRLSFARSIVHVLVCCRAGVRATFWHARPYRHVYVCVALARAVRAAAG